MIFRALPTFTIPILHSIFVLPDFIVVAIALTVRVFAPSWMTILSGFSFKDTVGLAVSEMDPVTSILILEVGD